MPRNHRHLRLDFLIALLAATLAVGCGDGDDSVVGPKGSTVDKDGGGNIDNDALTDNDAGGGQPDVSTQPDIPSEPDVPTQPDVPEQPDTTDAGAPDAGTPDTGPSTACPGAGGCSCTKNDECDIGICLDTHEGKKCAKKCVDSCDDKGYSCNEVGSGTDKIFVCVSEFVSLCSPCETDSQCQVNGIKSVCLDYGANGKFCGGLCDTDADCPDSYECIDAKDGAGNALKQCRRKKPAGSDTPALCGCSDWAKTKGFVTACKITNEFGSCPSKAGEGRKCTANGMSECQAKTPKAEVCNGDDDDCDGKTDILPDTVKCSVKKFEDAGSKTACKTDADCTVAGEKCDVDGDQKCKTLVGECAGAPTCQNGKFKCDAKEPTTEKCNELDDDCDGDTDEGFEWVNPVDGAKLKTGAACGVGPCENGKVTCKDNITAVCSTYGKVTPEKGACDGVDNDCNGKTDDLACDDGDACTKDVCDSANKKCSNDAAVNCDDLDQCTQDACDPKTGKCLNDKKKGSCDDGNKCTVGDACGEVDGKYVCVPGTDQPKCDDNNPCTDDVCKTDKGCVNTANSGKVPCYNGAKGTDGVGACKGGFQLCKDGKKLDKCDGEVVPNKSEACDGKDDDCDGKTDEGCKPTSVAVTFSSAYVSGKSGQGDKALDVQMLVGPSGPVGTAKGQKHQVDFGFMSWLMALVK